MASNTNSEWNINTDIYSIVDSVDALKAKYIDDQDETTLALSIFGFIGDTEAKKIQTSVIMAGELGNEMFASRAKLDKNILTHAIYSGIEGINAKPAHMTINVGIKESDLDQYMVVDEDNTEQETFIFDHNNPIYVGDYEFHFDYDITLRRIKRTLNSKEYYLYTALYDMDNTNELSTITNPYLSQPMVQNFNNYTYIFFECVVRQVSITTIEDTMITNSIIDNKSYTFTFEDQMADFEVYITDNGVTTRLKPYFYGSAVETGVTDYCWYLYINSNTIRIGFDSNSYIPGLNATIRIVAKTAIGASGNFSYDDNTENDIYVDFSSVYSNNKKVTCFIRCATDSTDGENRKTTAELKALIPKMAMSRGYITTETDLNNYFNLISTEDNRIKLQKKVDNQLERIWYAYFLMKDEDSNIIPTNSIRLRVNKDDSYLVKDDSSGLVRYVIPCGTTFVYNREDDYGVYIDPSTIPVPYSSDYFDEDSDKFYYRSPYNIVINDDPLYASYYMTIINQDSYFEYKFVNEDCGLGFTTIRNHFERSLLSNRDEYRFSFTMAQSINDDFGLIEEDSDGNIITNNIRCYLVLFQNGEPYRYIDCELQSFDKDTSYSTKWLATIKTDDAFDSKNQIKLTNLYEAGFNSTNYGFFENNTEAYLYICAKFDDVYPDEEMLLDKVVPGLSDDYTLVDVYKVNDGITLFNNFTSVMNTRVRKNVSEDESNIAYDIFGVPVVGEHFFDTVHRDVDEAENAVSYFTKEVANKKSYIDYCLELIENNMDIDFKFFNTYGPSKTYTVGYSKDIFLDHLDLTLNFKVKLSESSDLATRYSIIQFIKEYVEDVNDLGSLHFPNLIHDIKEAYSDNIIYIDFRYYNDKDLGVNHIQLQEPDDPKIVPEFLNVRNKLSNDEYTLVPCITVEIVND